MGRNITIDWEQRRYEIAKELLPSMLNIGEKLNTSFAAILAVNCADALISRLEKAEKINNENRKG